MQPRAQAVNPGRHKNEHRGDATRLKAGAGPTQGVGPTHLGAPALAASWDARIDEAGLGTDSDGSGKVPVTHNGRGRAGTGTTKGTNTTTRRPTSRNGRGRAVVDGIG